MKSSKLIAIAIAGFIAVAAAFAAMYFFKEEIIDFFVEVKSKIEAQTAHFFRAEEVDDYADL